MVLLSQCETHPYLTDSMKYASNASLYSISLVVRCSWNCQSSNCNNEIIQLLDIYTVAILSPLYNKD